MQTAQMISRKARLAKLEAIHAENRRILATGCCPLCRSALRQNLSMSGWWQCSQFGAVGFRADASKPACDFQMFTE